MAGVYEPHLDWAWLLNGGLARGQTRPIPSLGGIIIEHGGPHRHDPYRWRVDQWDMVVGAGWSSTRFEAMEAAERCMVDSGLLTSHDLARVSAERRILERVEAFERGELEAVDITGMSREELRALIERSLPKSKV